jgi:ubiquinone/menaquinone biosynthesis C-methylase UbiE
LFAAFPCSRVTVLKAKALKYKQRSRARFDKMAGDYGAHLAGKHAATLYGRGVKAIEEINPSAVLDVGRGNGNLLALLNDGARSLAGADLSPGMIKQARARLGDRVDLKLADSEALPWESGAFDAISCTDSFHHNPNPQIAKKQGITGSLALLMLGRPAVLALALRLIPAC